MFVWVCVCVVSACLCVVSGERGYRNNLRFSQKNTFVRKRFVRLVKVPCLFPPVTETQKDDMLNVSTPRSYWPQETPSARVPCTGIEHGVLSARELSPFATTAQNNAASHIERNKKKYKKIKQ